MEEKPRKRKVSPPGEDVGVQVQALPGGQQVEAVGCHHGGVVAAQV